MDEAVIRDALERAPGGGEGRMGHIPPTLSPEEAALRARMMCEDLAALGFDFEVKRWPIPDIGLVLPYYELAGTDYGLDAADEAPGGFKAHGFGLNWGIS
jgi:hypothetical protein